MLHFVDCVRSACPRFTFGMKHPKPRENGAAVHATADMDERGSPARTAAKATSPGCCRGPEQKRGEMLKIEAWVVTGVMTGRIIENMQPARWHPVMPSNREGGAGDRVVLKLWMQRVRGTWVAAGSA